MTTIQEIKNYLLEDGWQPTNQGNFHKVHSFSRNGRGKKKQRQMRVIFRDSACDLEMQSLYDTSWIRVGHSAIEKVVVNRKSMKIGDASLLKE